MRNYRTFLHVRSPGAGNYKNTGRTVDGFPLEVLRMSPNQIATFTSANAGSPIV